MRKTPIPAMAVAAVVASLVSVTVLAADSPPQIILGVCEARDGNVNIMAMHPYSVLQVSPDQLR